MSRSLLLAVCLSACPAPEGPVQTDTDLPAEAPAEAYTHPFAGPDDALGRAITAICSHNTTVPASGEAATAAIAAARAGAATLAEDPTASEQRILPVCRSLRPDQLSPVHDCMTLLSAFDTPATLAWLGEVAVRPIPADPQTDDGGENPGLAPEAWQVDLAFDALAARARVNPAVHAPLVDAAIQADPRARATAIRAVFSGVPRVEARDQLLARLPTSDHPLVFANP